MIHLKEKTMTKEKQTSNYFLSQVHQPFFVAGIFWAISLMTLFAVAYKLLLKGTVLLTVTPWMFHSYSLIFIVLTQFFIGFIFTTYPRFTQGEVVKKSYYMMTFLLFQVGALLFSLGAFYNKTVLIIGMLFSFLGMLSFFYKLFTLYLPTDKNLKHDPFWILFASALGVSTHILAISQEISSVDLHAYSIAFTLYITFFTFTIAQRMVPFFSHSFADKRPIFVHVIFSILLIKTFFEVLDLQVVASIIDISLSIILYKEFMRWELKTASAPAILKILHIALLWLPLGLFLGALSQLSAYFLGTSFIYAQTHLIALGFVLTMLIGFGSRVALGHSGRPPHADKVLIKIFILTQILVLARYLYSFSFGTDLNLFWLFDISIMLWIILFMFWGIKFAPILIFKKKV